MQWAVTSALWAAAASCQDMALVPPVQGDILLVQLSLLLALAWGVPCTPH